MPDLNKQSAVFLLSLRVCDIYKARGNWLRCVVLGRLIEILYCSTDRFSVFPHC